MRRRRGEMHHESIGAQTFVDEGHGLRCKLAFNPEGRKGLPSDYFEGVLERYDPADVEKEARWRRPRGGGGVLWMGRG